MEETNIEASDIQDELEGVMDEWFDTLCEDNSPAGKFTYRKTCIYIYNLTLF